MLSDWRTSWKLKFYYKYFISGLVIEIEEFLKTLSCLFLPQIGEVNTRSSHRCYFLRAVLRTYSHRFTLCRMESRALCSCLEWSSLVKLHQRYPKLVHVPRLTQLRKSISAKEFQLSKIIDLNIFILECCFFEIPYILHISFL